MSPAQRTWLMATRCKRYPQGGLWYQACQAQRWDYNDRALRLAVLSKAVDRRLSSANDLNQVGDFDKVIKHLGTLADDLKRAAESDAAGEARRTMKDVRDLMLELEELVAAPGDYVMAIIKDITRGRYGVRGIEDLDIEPRYTTEGEFREKISELEQFRRTLNARIHNRGGLKDQHAEKMARHDHEWGDSGYCVHCGTEQPAEMEEQPF